MDAAGQPSKLLLSLQLFSLGSRMGGVSFTEPEAALGSVETDSRCLKNFHNFLCNEASVENHLSSVSILSKMTVMCIYNSWGIFCLH